MIFLNNKDELCTVISIVQEFGHVSGLNLKKCECLAIGVFHRDNSFGVKWPTLRKYLAIHLGNDPNSDCMKNWDDKIYETERL